MSGSVSAGFLTRTYDDAVLDTVTTPALAAELAWSPKALTTVTASASTAFIGSTVAGEGASKLYSGALGISRDVRENLTIDALGRIQLQSSQGRPRRHHLHRRARRPVASQPRGGHHRTRRLREPDEQRRHGRIRCPERADRAAFAEVDRPQCRRSRPRRQLGYSISSAISGRTVGAISSRSSANAHIGRDEPVLGAAIICAALERVGVEGLPLEQPVHRVRQLDLSARTAFLVREQIEDLRL